MGLCQRVILKVLLKELIIGVNIYNGLHQLSNVICYLKELMALQNIYAKVSKIVHAYKEFHPKVSLYVLLKEIHDIEKYLCQVKQQGAWFQWISSKGKLRYIDWM